MGKTLVNKTFNELRSGDKVSRSQIINQIDVEKFADISGDHNPLHVDEKFASETRFGGRIAHGILCAGYISALIGEELPGPGSIYMSQNLEFLAPVKPGDTIIATVAVKELHESSKKPGTGRVVLDTVCVNHKGETVLKGEAMVLAPEEKAEFKKL
jgi:acyl dehydratase